MKKTVFGIFAGLLVAGFLSSCGEKLLTAEQMTAKINEGYNQQAATIAAEMDKACTDGKDARVAAEVERLKTEAEAAKKAEAEAKAAADAAAKAAKKKK